MLQLLINTLLQGGKYKIKAVFGQGVCDPGVIR